MSFTGFTFAAQQAAMSLTPTQVDSINRVELNGGIYDNLYITDSSSILDAIPDNWDWNTIMWAQFNGTLTAGNLAYMLDQINALRIKRRIKGETEWITLFEVPVSGIEDLTFSLYDKYVQYGKEYEYALVPVVDTIESEVIGREVEVKFNGLYITDGETSYHTLMECGVNTYQRNHGGSTVETLNNRYPYFVQNSAVNYDSGSAQGLFLPVKQDGCKITTDNAFDYRQGLLNFLRNGRAKILKDCFGQIWMVQVTDDPNVQGGDHPHKMIVTFNWSEVGDVNSQQDLYDNGLITVAPHITDGGT